MLVPLSAFGITSSRRLLTRSVVAFSAGPFFEIALKYALVPGLSIWIGVIAATPEVEETSFCRVCSRGSVARGSDCELLDELLDELVEDAGWAGEPSDTAMISGPFTP